MNEIELQRRTNEVLQTLAWLPAGEAIAVLHKAMGRALQAKNPELPRAPVLPLNPNLLPRKRGGVSKIDADPEVKAFIHALPVQTSIEDIAAQCASRFGPERAPKKSAVHRYLQKLSRRFPQDKQDEKENNT